MGRKPGKGNALAKRLPSTGGRSPQGTGPGQPTLERGRLSNAQPMGGPGSGTRPGGQLLRPFCLRFNSHTFRNWSGGVGVGLAWVSRHHAPPPHLAQLPRLMVGTRHTAGVSGQGCRAGTGAQYLVDVVQAGAFIRPVGVALLDAVLRQRGQHDDHHAALLPHHLHRESGRAARTC